MEKIKLLSILVIVTALIGVSGCSSKKKDTGKFQVMIVEAPLQCDAEPKELKAECKCPEHNEETIATTISAVGSVIGNLISTIWD